MPFDLASLSVKWVDRLTCAVSAEAIYRGRCLNTGKEAK